ncbi:MAG TPA: TAXI family TRAP transporter solute-binding subunit [Polyangia bacterium]|nr:TAXI family TRAP transporter solute-binding subunit [Polyangia bacterium]
MGRPGARSKLGSMTGRDLALIAAPILVLLGLGGWVARKSIGLAPPNRIRIVSGPPGSKYREFAERYQAIIARYGVKVEIVPSAGAIDNLRQLADRSKKVDVGFVQGGLRNGTNASGLVSLGSLYEQPLMIYFRGSEPADRLSALRGKRLAIGPEGTAARALALELLAASDMAGPPTELVDLAGNEAAQALVDGKIDAVFLMGDSATRDLMHRMRETPHVQLLGFRQADAYVRRFQFLSKLTLPEGALDLARDYPPQAVQLIGTTVELVARDTLHPALSDLLISAAREVHGGAGLFRNAGEYPAPLARDFPLSKDAERYYKSGEQFLYKRLPFWLASVLDRLLVLLVPLIVAIIPVSRLIPAIYRWRIRSRIYRWYGALMGIERDLQVDRQAAGRADLLRRLDEITAAVNELTTPASFADQVYVLRDHVAAVRRRIHEARSVPVAVSS